MYFWKPHKLGKSLTFLMGCKQTKTNKKRGICDRNHGLQSLKNSLSGCARLHNGPTKCACPSSPESVHVTLDSKRDFADVVKDF